MMFLDRRFYLRSVSFWPPHIHKAQASGEINPEVDVDVATDMVMRLAVSLVLFPHMGAQLSTRREIRDYLEHALLRGLAPPAVA